MEELLKEIIDRLERIETIIHPGKTNEDLLSIESACELLNVSRQTLWLYTKKKYIRSHRIGKKVLYKRSDLMKGIKEVVK